MLCSTYTIAYIYKWNIALRALKMEQGLFAWGKRMMSRQGADGIAVWKHLHNSLAMMNGRSYPVGGIIRTISVQHEFANNVKFIIAND